MYLCVCCTDRILLLEFAIIESTMEHDYLEYAIIDNTIEHNYLEVVIIGSTLEHRLS